MAQLSAATHARLRSLQSSSGISLRSASHCTLAEIRLQDQHCDEDGWVHIDTCMQLGWVASAEQAGKLVDSGRARLTDSAISLFTRGGGDTLFAQAETLYEDWAGARLRVRLFRFPRGQSYTEQYLIGEYSTRVVMVGDATVAVPAAAISRDESGSVEPVEMTTRERAMEARRRQIFDGACEVIGREGYAATTMRKVAKASGLPLSSIYQYIDTKEDLLFMITSTCMEEIFDYMHAELVAEGSAQEKMEHAVDAYLKYVSKNRRYINLVYRETRALSAANREKIFDIERRFTQLWERIIVDGNKTKEFDIKKTCLAANLIYFVCNLWSLRYWSVEEYSEDEVREYLLRFILSGLKA